jgi:hypothetical protein
MERTTSQDWRITRAQLMALPRRFATEHAVEVAEWKAGTSLAQVYGGDAPDATLRRLVGRLELTAKALATSAPGDELLSPLVDVRLVVAEPDLLLVIPGPGWVDLGGHSTVAAAVRWPLESAPASESGLRDWAMEVSEAVLHVTRLLQGIPNRERVSLVA